VDRVFYVDLLVYIRHREFRGVGKSVRPLLFVILVTYLNSQFLLNYTNPSLFILKAHLLFMPTSGAALSAKALGFLIPTRSGVPHHRAILHSSKTRRH